ncbi:hypothetical protein [Acinetobacter higginsii]|uniref:hypothetical protein n=1 Tax=Acinetobacter higginsii TaxID=70347 RepID=UPI001F623F25|nr:hypothetical protein [Acinetobacter higginsii]MCI3878467.1 hypothetical protein [Acinetobacter higginsii]
MKKILILLPISLLTSCSTSLSVKHVDLTHEYQPSKMVGAPYPLGFTRYKVDITRQVIGCNPFKGIVKADIKVVESAPDPLQMFVIDTNSLSNIFKTSTVTLEYKPNKMVSSLNATAEDHTVQVISNIVSSGIKVASILAAASGPVQDPQADCTTDTSEALKAVSSQKSTVTITTKKTDTLTEEVAALNAKIATLGINVDKTTKLQLSNKYDELKSATAESQKAQDALEKSLKSLSNTQSVYWPDNGNQASGSPTYDKKIVLAWVDLKKGISLKNIDLSQFDVWFKLEKTISTGRDLKKEEVVDTRLGLPYRQPESGKLTICGGGSCDDTSSTILAEKTGDVLQLGHIYYFPCRSPSFSSVSCSFSMTDTGQIKAMGSENKVSSAEAATIVLKDALTQYSTFQKDKSDAKINKIKAETDLLSAQSAQESIRVAGLTQDTKDATAILTADTALKSAKIANIQAQEQLDAANSRK